SERFRSKPCPFALRAGDVAHELLNLLPPVLGVCLDVAFLEISYHAVKPGHVLPPPTVAVAIGDVNTLVVCAVEDEVLVLIREIPPRHVESYPVLLGEPLQNAPVVLRLGVGPRYDRALV